MHGRPRLFSRRIKYGGQGQGCCGIRYPDNRLRRLGIFSECLDLLSELASNFPDKIRTLVQMFPQIQVNGRIKTVFGANSLAKHDDLGSFELDQQGFLFWSEVKRLHLIDNTVNEIGFLLK